MQRNTPLDYLWLAGELTGTADIIIEIDNVDKEHSIFNLLDDMGLSVIKEGIIQIVRGEKTFKGHESKGWLDGLDIYDFLLAETSKMSAEKLNPPYDTTKLIYSLREGIWSRLPQSVRENFESADKQIREERFNTAATELCVGLEAGMRHLHKKWCPKLDKQITLLEIESALYARAEILKDCDRKPYYTIQELVPLAKNIRTNEWNPLKHEGKEYDLIEVVSLWHIATRAITRIARILEHIEPLPKQSSDL